jgi:G3E family GTPase
MCSRHRRAYKSDARAWLNAPAYEQHDGDDNEHTHHGHDDHDHRHGLHGREIASFCFVREKPIPREALRLLLAALQQNLGPNVSRVKGIVHVAEEPDRPAVIQGANISYTTCRGLTTGRTSTTAARSCLSRNGSIAPRSRT